MIETTGRDEILLYNGEIIKKYPIGSLVKFDGDDPLYKNKVGKIGGYIGNPGKKFTHFNITEIYDGKNIFHVDPRFVQIKWPIPKKQKIK